MARDLFEFLTKDDRAKLFESAVRRSYSRGDFVFREGDVQPNLYILRKGLVRVERQYHGMGLAVARYGSDEVLGEVAFLADQRAHGSAVAEEDVDVEVLEGRRIAAMLASDTGLASRFYQSLAVCLGDRLLQVLPGIMSQDSSAAHLRPRLERVGQITERQLPQELIEGVEQFRAAMAELASGLRTGRLEVAAAQQQTSRACDTVADLLNRLTQDSRLIEIGVDDLLSFRDVPNLARGIGSYVFRETFSNFMQSATIAQGYDSARGDGEAHEFLERMERNDPEGDGRLGPMIDRWFLERPLCQGRRNSVERMLRFLNERLGEARGPQPVRITSLAAGTAREVFALLRGSSRPIYFTSIDNDADAILANTEQAKELGCADRITFLNANLATLVAGQTPLSLGSQHLIYGLGVADYLDDERLQILLDWCHERLEPGGRLALTNRDARSPDRAFVEHILDWPVFYRTTEQLAGVLGQSRFGGGDVSDEAAGNYLFAECRRV